MYQYDFPVSLQPIFDRKGVPIEGKRCVVRDDNNKVLSLVSDKYGLIEHKALVEEIVPEIIRNKPNYAAQVYLDKDGRIFNYVLNYKADGYKMRKVGEQVGFQIIVRNSYDAKSCATVKVGALILSCSNGMVSHRSTANIGIRHVDGILQKTNIPSADQLEESFLSTIEKWDALGASQFNKNSIHKTVQQLVTDNILLSKKAESLADNPPDTYWDFMQFVTAHVTHDRPKLTHDSRIALMGRATSWLENNYKELVIKE